MYDPGAQLSPGGPKGAEPTLSVFVVTAFESLARVAARYV